VSLAVLCPGQGAQKVGMAGPWTKRSQAARDVFQRCSDALDLDLHALCEEGPAERLTRTDVCQPAILAVSAASLAALQEDGALKPEDIGAAIGLSLGEYTALHVAGVLTVEDAVKLVRLRGIAMQDASEAPKSGLTCLIGIDRDGAQAICDEAQQDGVCVVANLNCPGQVVISGDLEALTRAESIADEKKLARAIRLDVAGAFHSPLMEPARERLEAAIAETEFHDASFPVISNATAEASTDKSVLRQNLVRQLTSPVLFEASLRGALESGVDRFRELSPGRVLAGFMRKIDRKIPVATSDGGER